MIFLLSKIELPVCCVLSHNKLENLLFLQVNFERTEQTPTEYFLFAYYERNMHSPTMTWRSNMTEFLAEDSEEFFNTEKYDEEEEAAEEERRADFRKYVESYNTDEDDIHLFFYSAIRSVGGGSPHSGTFRSKAECDKKMRHCRVKVKNIFIKISINMLISSRKLGFFYHGGLFTQYN